MMILSISGDSDTKQKQIEKEDERKQKDEERKQKLEEKKIRF